MKTFGLFFCFCFFIASCSHSNNLDSVKAEIIHDADFEKYIELQKGFITERAELKNDLKEPGYLSATTIEHKASGQADKYERLRIYLKLHKRYIDTGKLTREELKAIVRDVVTTDLQAKR